MNAVVFDVEQAAAYLATSVKHLYRLSSQRRIPSTKVGGKLRFSPRDLDRWLEQNRRDVKPVGRIRN